jgi:hypothetical protein
VFDASDLQRFAGHLPCPEIDETVLHRYFQFGQADGWGKRRPQLPAVPIWAEEALQRLLSSFSRAEWRGLLRQYGIVDTVCGADVLGPGGGQWRIAIDGVGPTMTPGLPSGDQPIFRFTVKKLAQLAGIVKGPRLGSHDRVLSVDNFSSDRRRCQRLIRGLVARLARSQRGQGHPEFGVRRIAG